jgi:hypothetical protein
MKKLALLNPDNTVNDIANYIGDHPFENVFSKYKVIDITNNDQPIAKDWNYHEEDNSFTEPVTLEYSKIIKLKQIDSDAQVTMYQDVIVNDHVFQGDQLSQDLLSKAINLTLAGLPLPLAWIDKSNIQVPITNLADLISIAAPMQINVQTAKLTANVKKVAVVAAITVSQVNAI